MSEIILKTVQDMVHGFSPGSGAHTIAPLRLPQVAALDPRRTLLLNFLRTVLPENGPVYFAFTLPARRHYACRTLDELTDRLLALDADATQETYFAAASFSNEWIVGADGERRQRTSDNVAAARACWLDIDIGKHKAQDSSGYANTQDVSSAIADFSLKLGIDPTLVVASGRGQHVYFAFTEPVTPAEWKPVAKALKHACVLAGLRSDPSRTEDIASVLRPLMCTHRKDPASPQTVKPLAVGEPVKFSEFAGAVRRFVISSQKPAVTADNSGDDLISFPVAGETRAKSVLRDMSINDDLAAGIGEYRHWILSLPADDQVRVLDSACAAIPDNLWSKYEVWCGIMAALRGLSHLDESQLLGLLQRHSERSPKWAADRWTPERLRAKFLTFAGGSVRRIFDLAEAHGWRESESPVLLPFKDAAAAEKYFVERFVYVTDQSGYLDTKSRQIISPAALDESQSWLITEIRKTPRTILRFSTRTRRTDTQGYHPGAGAIYEEHEMRFANLYVPWSPARLHPTAEELDLWRWFIEDHLFRRPEDGPARDYFLNVLAYPLQNPGRRVASVPLLIGESYGSGKSTLFERIPRLVFGTRNVTVVTQSEIESGFNDWHNNAQVVCFPEIWMGASRDAERVANDLKDKITSDVLRVHPKGLKGFSQTNRATLLATSNHEDAVYLRDGDRRWGVHVTDAPKMAAMDSQRLYAFLESNRAPGVLREILFRRDLSQFNPAGEPPTTAGKKIAIAASRSPLADEILEAIDNRESPFDRDLVTIEDIRTFLQVHGYRRREVSARRIALILKANPISATLLGRKRIYAGLPVSGVNTSVSQAVKRNVWCLRGTAAWCTASETAIAKHLRDGSPALAPVAVTNMVPGAGAASPNASTTDLHGTPRSSVVLKSEASSS